MPRASILIPVYNSAPTLARCLRSAMQQTMADIEILVADDASTDDSAAIAETIAATDPRITLLRLPQNGGKPKAMNILVQRATGDFLAVLDADDAFHESRLQTLIDQAERAGADMAADNLLYIDAGIPAQTGPCAGFGAVIRAAFDPNALPRIVTKADLAAKSSSFAEFDYGILKPVMRASFLRLHALTYDETSRLAEDFTYLMRFLVAGGLAVLWPAPLYYWTMPFGTLSRAWTQTGAGAWRYDYRQALLANADLVTEMRARGETAIVTMLLRRARQYRAMIPYIDAQRQAAGGDRLGALLTLISHPNAYSLLALRIAGRMRRAIGRPAAQAA